MLVRSFVPLLLAMKAMAASANSELVFTPHRLAYDDLTSHSTDTLLIDSLAQEGIVSITGIPGFKDMTRSLLANLHSCLKDMEDQDVSVQNEYSDGTVRRTMASVTIPGPGGARPFDYDADSKNCQEFAKELDMFRKTVDTATDQFAQRLSLEMGTALESPLMHTEDGEYSFAEFKDVVRNGEHLEHFHSYQKLSPTEKASENTIDVHTDQGLFIAFTPALIASHDESTGAPDLNSPMQESEGFYVETSQGKTAMVDLTSEDDLVFMLGDGVNQYINTKLKKDEQSLSKILRATPHAVKLQVHGEHLARVWYGLMVLPPSSAYSEKDGMTYGEIRNLLTASKNDDIPVGLGCSSTDMRALEGGDECFEQGAMRCWHRCMPLVDHDVSFDTCTDENHAIKCVNPRLQVSTGENHGDYLLKCTDSVAEVTPYPPLPQSPQDPEVCTQDAWDAFNMEGNDYMYSFNLTTDRTDANFYWTPNAAEGKIKGRLVFNGQYGWISFGFINQKPDAGHKGMNGGHVVMATLGDPYTYSPVTGFDLTTDSKVAEYVINEFGSSYRHWNIPEVDETNAEVTVSEGDCFTSLEFDLDKIHETEFDVEGHNNVMWAANPTDYFGGYHSRHRAFFTVEWMTGKVLFGKELNPVLETAVADGPIVTPTETDASGVSSLSAPISVAFTSIFSLLYMFA